MESNEKNGGLRKPPREEFQELKKLQPTHSSVVNLHIDETKSKIPDGGWGWFVVLAALFINLAADGAICTFGFLNVEFLEAFGASASLTSWVGSLFVAVPLLAGPLCSALVDRYGCKLMTICGALTCTFGFILSSYANSIIMLMFTFGIVGGIGLGMGYVTAVVAVAFWFEKKRTIALGLAASGTGFGTIVYSPLVTFLIHEYGWRGTLFILGGLFTNLCVAGCLMRDPDWVIEKEGNVTIDAHAIKKDIDHSSSPIRKKAECSDQRNVNVETSVTISNNDKFQSLVDLRTYLKHNKEIPVEVLQNLTNEHDYNRYILENYSHLLKSKSSSDTNLNKSNSRHEIIPQSSPTQLIGWKFNERESQQAKAVSPKSSEEEEQKVELLTRSDSTKSGGKVHHPHNYLRNVTVRKNSIAYRSAMLNIHKYKLSAASCPDFFRNSYIEKEEEWYEEYLDVLKDLTSFSLFLNFHFFLMSMCTVMVNIWFIVPFFYLPHHMKENDYTDDDVAKAFLGNGIMTILGMVAISWLGNKFDEAKLYALCLIGCGISTGAIMFFTNYYWPLMISSAVFGLFFASIFSLTPAILAKLVPLEKFTMAYGLNLLCHGIGNLVGPPIAGLLYDVTKSYAQSFYQAAFWIIISGVLVGLIPFTKNRVLCAGLYKRFAKINHH